MGAPSVGQPFPFFKETESNKKCCGCGDKAGASAESLQVTGLNPAQFNTMPSSSYINNGNHFMKIENNAQVQMLKNPVPIGTGQYTGAHAPNTPEYSKARTSLNLDLLHKDSK